MDRHIRGMAQVLCFVSWRRLVRRLPRWHECVLAVALRAVLSFHVQVGVQVAASWENMKPLEGKHETRWENMKPKRENMKPIPDGFLCGMVCPGGGFTRGPQPQRPGWCLPLRLRLHLWHECVLAVVSRAVFSFGGVLYDGFLVGMVFASASTASSLA